MLKLDIVTDRGTQWAILRDASGKELEEFDLQYDSRTKILSRFAQALQTAGVASFRHLSEALEDKPA